MERDFKNTCLIKRYIVILKLTLIFSIQKFWGRKLISYFVELIDRALRLVGFLHVSFVSTLHLKLATSTWFRSNESPVCETYWYNVPCFIIVFNIWTFEFTVSKLLNSVWYSFAWESCNLYALCLIRVCISNLYLLLTFFLDLTTFVYQTNLSHQCQLSTKPAWPTDIMNTEMLYFCFRLLQHTPLYRLMVLF